MRKYLCLDYLGYSNNVCGRKRPIGFSYIGCDWGHVVATFLISPSMNTVLDNSSVYGGLLFISDP